ncbi:putative methyltransferase [Streptomyces hygroscopicus subsp. jinggangensis 5008]|nr:putative methyltransferase [Streptomyces hygroscopicus subsp. jinggangensis 5008]AGF60820.1 putative methyltransferase [Streptomyces hygroscopicus subsp. jinggangensis TL01]
MLAPGELLWDIGGGSGSIAIEWMRTHPSCRAVTVERDPVRAERIARNAERLGVPGLRVVTGAAPAALAELAPPSAVFIGGGLTAPGLLDACWDALPAGGRLVADTVTLESEALLADAYRCHGELVKLAVAHAVPVGGFTGWRQAMPVTQWAVEKPPQPFSWSRQMTVYFIGAGPGAADLITVRGARTLAACQVCLYAGSLVLRELLAGSTTGGYRPAQPGRDHCRVGVCLRSRSSVSDRLRGCQDEQGVSEAIDGRSARGADRARLATVERRRSAQ